MKIPNIFIDRDQRVSLLEKIILFTVFFPFIPSIIRSADTQPTFTLLILFAIFYTLLHRNYKLFDLSNVHAFTILVIGFLTFFSVALNYLYTNNPFYITRIFAFVQFLLAVVVGLTYRFEINKEVFYKILWVYLIFTVIYFLTSGAVEKILIGSRTDSAEFLMKTGRGAKTLSPEPAFFALQIFNIVIIYFLLFGENFKERLSKRVILLSILCFLSSLSGYGILLVGALIFFRYTKFTLVSFAFLILLAPFILPSLESFRYIRAIGLVLSILTSNPLILMKVDPSIATRVFSFLEYINSIINHFLIGNGFSILKGGGFISIIASLGFVGLIFFLWFILEIVKLRNFTFPFKTILLFWFLLNLISGPIGIPALGIIIGLIFRNNYPEYFSMGQRLSHA